MKKIFIAVICAFMLTGCSLTSINSDSDTLTIVTTVYAEYDWVREVLGEEIENVNVIQLIDGGVDLHSYQPSADDIITIRSCDLFIYGGGESSEWVEEVLNEDTNENQIALNLLELLGDDALEEETTEGMEHSHDDECTDEECTDEECTDEEHDHDEECTDEECTDEEHDHDEECTDEECTDEECTDEEHDHDEECSDECCEEGVLDEHFWLSLNNAKTLSTIIANSIIELSPEMEEAVTANLATFSDELDELDSRYEEVTSDNSNVLLFGDRFPFIYLLNDYDIEYYAAFAGCTTDTTASFDTVITLAEKVDEYDLNYVLTTETGHEVANTIIENTTDKDQEIIALNSMQSQQSTDDTSYLQIMEENLLVIEKALN